MPDIADDSPLLYAMRVPINRSQLEGHHVRFDEPDELAKLVEQAGSTGVRAGTVTSRASG